MSQKVLIVDDDLLTATDVSDTLTASGYQVHIAADGPQALVESQKLKPDIVLLDLVLPTMTGIAVCAELRRLVAQREKHGENSRAQPVGTRDCDGLDRCARLGTERSDAAGDLASEWQDYRTRLSVLVKL